MEGGASTSTWAPTSVQGPVLDSLGPLMQPSTLSGSQTGVISDSTASQTLLTGLHSDALAATASSRGDTNSVLKLQQNLQRLYGSLGHLHGSRSSLPDIQEEEPHAAAAARIIAQGRSTSDDDLFRMDPLGGPSSSGAQPQISDLGLVGQMPASDGAESRTLFIRGIDPSSSDRELMEFFECFGDVRALYTACKQRGMIVIGYHDIRAATLAHHTLHGQEVKGRLLTCQFTFPKDPNEAASGTLLVASIGVLQTKQDLFYVLSKYGELRELKDDPMRPNCCIAEYFDARHAAAAMQGVNQSPETSGRILVLAAESLAAASGLRANSGLQQQQHDHHQQQSELRNAISSPALAMLGSSSSQLGSSSHLDAPSLLLGSAAAAGGAAGQQPSNGTSFLSNDLVGMTRSLSEMSLEGQGLLGRLGGGGGGGGGSNHGGVGSMSTGDLLSMQPGPGGLHQGMGMRGAASTGSLWPQSGANGVSMGSSPLGGGGGVWSTNSLASLQQEQHQVQHAAQQVAYLQQQQNALVQTAAMQAALQQALLVQQAQQAAFNRHPVIGGVPRRGFSEPALGGRLARRPTDPAAEAERRAQQERLYSLDLAKIMAGGDKRTTLMVKNIPNKYTQKMLLALIEERFHGTFDFFYLPIDFKNRCNVGYAFINMTSPRNIPPLVQEFHGKRWPKFNSEKICQVAYARIQGKSALVQHFQNSSLLHEDKRCRPVLFKDDGANGELEAFPLGPAGDSVDNGGVGGGEASGGAGNGAAQGISGDV